MKRDMELVRLILLKIEEEYVSTALQDIKIEGYDKETIAYHCKIMYENGLISDYKPYYAGNKLMWFSVGSLTWDGNEYLDTVRDESMWAKIKAFIKDKAVPLTMEAVKLAAPVLLEATLK